MSGLTLPQKVLDAAQALTEARSGILYDELKQRYRENRRTTTRVSSSSSFKHSDFFSEWQNERMKIMNDSMKFLETCIEVIQNDQSITATRRRNFTRAVRERREVLRYEKLRHEISFKFANEQIAAEDESSDHLLEFLAAFAGADNLLSAYDELLRQYLDGKQINPGKTLAINDHVPRTKHSQWQTHFRESCREFYDAEDLDRESAAGNLFCVVTGQYWKVEEFKTAHIVPWYLGGRTAAYMFGIPPEHGDRQVIWNKQNSLPMCDKIERLFDNHQVTIAPGSNAGEFIFLVFDLHAGKQELKLRDGSKIKIEDLHGQPLQFRNDNRPRPEYVFWHFLFTLKRRRVAGVMEWEFDQEKIALKFPQKEQKIALQQMFGRKTGLIRKSTLAALAKREGFDTLPGDFKDWMTSYGIEDDGTGTAGKDEDSLQESDLAGLQTEEFEQIFGN
ncbi:hypothetical protein HII31_11174 [Pseudocercospora fuligena]|uniref:HNH nuclease domain-containing protein n=1 Tax=Pseudocercospora fuligena TaxID=685502 RepID=A0A8H6VI32_9PEZI|nr:hypothetical protein HII31_11174 [Pseudocercospora fuligena]